MTLCPVALAITCRKCPVVGFCPGRSVIGDYAQDESGEASGKTGPAPAKPEDTH